MTVTEPALPNGVRAPFSSPTDPPPRRRPEDRTAARPGRIDVTRLPVPIDGSIRVREWSDPYLDEHGHDVRSSYVELFWLGILGPSATMLLRRLVFGLEHAPGGFCCPVGDTARSLGLGAPTSRQSPFIRALHRCVVFRVARFEGDDIEVRRRLPTLNHAQLQRLPDSLGHLHIQALEHRDRCRS